MAAWLHVWAQSLRGFWPLRRRNKVKRKKKWLEKLALFNTENSLCDGGCTAKNGEKKRGKQKEKTGWVSGPANCCSKSRQNLKVIK